MSRFRLVEEDIMQREEQQPPVVLVVAILGGCQCTADFTDVLDDVVERRSLENAAVVRKKREMMQISWKNTE